MSRHWLPTPSWSRNVAGRSCARRSSCSEDGYYTTTIHQIAKQAGISTGLIHQYFRDKDDILFLSLKMVLDTYEHEIPSQTNGLTDPVERLCVSVWAYCHIVDRLREATVLAYRSTKSLAAPCRFTGPSSRVVILQVP